MMPPRQKSHDFRYEEFDLNYSIIAEVVRLWMMPPRQKSHDFRYEEF
jgi:hypothetical protein